MKRSSFIRPKTASRPLTSNWMEKRFGCRNLNCQNCFKLTELLFYDILGISIRQRNLRKIQPVHFFAQVREEGHRIVNRRIPYYNLDMIISVGYDGSKRISNGTLVAHNSQLNAFPQSLLSVVR